MPKILYLLLVLIGALPWPALAQILTPTELRSSERLGIYLSSFDPPSQEDIQLAEKLVREHGLDYLILMPMCEAPAEECAALSHRLQMLELATKDHPQLRILLSSAPENEQIHFAYAVAQSTQANVPQTLIFSRSAQHKGLVGDAKNLAFVPLTEPATFDARAYLREHLEIYFGQPDAFISLKRPPFPDGVLGYVQQSGLYFLDNGPPPQLRYVANTSSKIKGWVYQGLRRLALLYVVQSFRGKHPTPEKSEIPRKFTFDNHIFYVVGYLGSGSQSDAYVVSVDGERYVLKVPRGNSEEHLYYARQTTLTHRWLLHQKMPNIPALIDYDPEGLWSLSEFIEGESMFERVGAGLELSKNELESYREIFDYALALYRRSGVRLDLWAPNVILRNERAYLVDLGTALESWFPTGSFDEWINLQRCRYRQAEVFHRRNEVVLTCAKRLLHPLGLLLRRYREPNFTLSTVRPAIPLLSDSVGSSHCW